MKTKLTKLKEYFKKEDVVILAFLFGSASKNRYTQNSDVDIAVYLKDKERLQSIYSKISHILGKEVDLICLEEAPSTLVSHIFKYGIPLVIKDKRLFWDIYLRESIEAEDFLHFVEDYLRIYNRSLSFAPEDKARLLQRLQFLKEELKEINVFNDMKFEEYMEDKIKRRNMERWAENVLNATIDIAKLVLACEKKKMPKSYQDALYHFCLFVGLKKKEAEEFSYFANLRNILAHEYLDVLYKRIKEFLSIAPNFYIKILDFIEKTYELAT